MSSAGIENRAAGAWPALPLKNWKETRDTLHMWAQIAGKIRLEFAPYINHWWNSTFYVNARGLTTSPASRTGRTCSNCNSISSTTNW